MEGNLNLTNKEGTVTYNDNIEKLVWYAMVKY